MGQVTTLSSRGRIWFEALSGKSSSDDASIPASVLICDSHIGDEEVLFLCVVPNPEARFPMARQGEVGLEEAYALASSLRDLLKKSSSTGHRCPVVAIIDVKSQAYGRREETAAIYHAAACAADAFATARRHGHPIVSLVVGQALSGGFLTHGYQANRILAFDDPGVMIHAMHKEAAARVTKRTVAELDKLAELVIPLSYEIKDFAKLGILHELLTVDSPEAPSEKDIAWVKERLLAAIKDARSGSSDLSVRWTSDKARVARQATLATRRAMFEQWDQN